MAFGALARLTRIARRTVKTAVAEIRKGDWVEHEGRTMVVHSISSMHSGRGTRTYGIALRDPASTAVAATLRQSVKDALERHDPPKDVPATFLYASEDGRVLHVLAGDTGQGSASKEPTEMAVPASAVTGGQYVRSLLEAGASMRVRVLEDGRIVLAQPAARTMAVTVASLAESWTDSENRKRSFVRTVGGARVAVPTELTPGDRILVNVDDLSYHGRAVS